MDWEMVAALGGVVAAAAAVIALWVEGQRSRRGQEIGLLNQLSSTYASERMYQFRSRAAKSFLSRTEELDLSAIDELAAFFEGLGFLVKEGVIQERYAWFYFFNDLNWFCKTYSSYIEERRQSDRTTWSDLVWLSKTLKKVEAREHNFRSTKHIYSEEEKQKYLEKERDLIN